MLTHGNIRDVNAARTNVSGDEHLLATSACTLS
jgi:hypothetical protein